MRRLRIRDGGARDLLEVRRLLSAANEHLRAALAGEAFDAYLEMVLALDERLEEAELIVVSDAEHLVGTVTFFPDAAAEGWGWSSGVCGIRSMGVRPAAQRRGVGAVLLHECVRRAAAQRSSAVVLHTAHYLDAAIRLYERHGFVRDPAHDIRARDVMEIPASLDYAGLAYRLDLVH